MRGDATTLARFFSTRSVALAAQPSAWRAAVTEQAWRFRPPCPVPGAAAPEPPIDVTVFWPERYRHASASAFVEPVRLGLTALTTVVRESIDQPYPGVVRFDVALSGRRFPVALDYYDFALVNDECLVETALYFKMQHRRVGYDDAKVVPGGYIGNKQTLYDNYCRLRALRSKPYRFDVYGRFTLNRGRATGVRRDAVGILSSDRRFTYTGGTGLARYAQSLLEAARARICIDLPGLGPFCFRLVEYLAMGCFVIGPRHDATLHADLRDGEHLVYCRDDLSDLADLCVEYAGDHRRRDQIAANAAQFFDEHLHEMPLARYYLETLEQRLTASSGQRSSSPIL